MLLSNFRKPKNTECKNQRISNISHFHYWDCKFVKQQTSYKKSLTKDKKKVLLLLPQKSEQSQTLLSAVL